MGAQISSSTNDQNQHWVGCFHNLTLPSSPTESTVKDYLRNTFIPNELIRIRQKSRMVGNDKGLSIVDVIQERLDALESRAEIREQKTKSLKADIKSLKADNESFESEMQLIRIPELLRFLPSGQRPDNLQRNQLVHGANVEFDLSFLDSLSTKNLSFLSNHRLQISDLDKAFNKRYENNPAIFRREMSDAMGEVINMRSNLLNLDVWKSVTDPARKQKIKNLKRKCGRLIKKWLSQPEPQPYSEEEMRSRLDDLYKEFHAYVVQ